MKHSKCRVAYHNLNLAVNHRTKPFTSDEERLFKLYEEMPAKEKLV